MVIFVILILKLPKDTLKKVFFKYFGKTHRNTPVIEPFRLKPIPLREAFIFILPSKTSF